MWEQLLAEKEQVEREAREKESHKDDVGKNIHELEKAKRQLEATVEEQRQHIEELEEATMESLKTRTSAEIRNLILNLLPDIKSEVAVRHGIMFEQNKPGSAG